jgi:MFS transporter, FHS family, Na+ dependent glucose transporter 1
MTDTTANVETITTEPEVSKIASTSGYYLSFIGLGLSMAVIGPTLPRFVELTGTSYAAVSYLTLAKSLGYLIGTAQAGQLYDRLPGHKLIVAALATMAAMIAFVPFVPLIWVLGAVLFVSGLGDAVLDVGANSLIVWVHKRNVDPFMNALHFCFGVGAFLAPLVIAFAISVSDGIALAYWVVAGFLVLPAIWLFRLNSPRPATHDEADATGEADTSLVLLIAIFFFTFVGAELGFGTWIASYAQETGSLNEEMSALLTSAFWGGLTLGRLVGIPLSTRLSPRFMLTSDIAGSVASLLLILAFPGVEWALWVGSIGMGVSVATMFATGLNYAEKRMTITGKVTSAFLVGGSIGGMTVTWLIGQLFERIGPRVTIVAILVDMVLAAGVFVAIMIYAGRRPSPTR